MKHRRKQLINFNLLFCAFALLLACTNSASHNGITVESLKHGDQNDANTYVYECSGGYGFVARVQREKAWLFLPEQTVKLPGVPAASGAKYSDGSTLFWTEGDDAFLKTGSKRHSACQNNRAKAIWEDAKLRGVGFRAVGNEPGWYLEITPSENTVFVTDYGEFQHSVITPQPVTDQNKRKSTYSVENTEHDLAVEIQGQSCEDTMSGETFEATVTVKLDGTTYRGCGRALH